MLRDTGRMLADGDGLRGCGLAHVAAHAQRRAPVLCYRGSWTTCIIEEPKVGKHLHRVQVVGGGRCPIVDTWWQTETGAHMITPLPGATTLKPSSATLPFFGVQPAILNEKGEELEGPAEGCALLGDGDSKCI